MYDVYLILLVAELEVFAPCVRFREVLEAIRYGFDRDGLRIVDCEGDAVHRPDRSHAAFSGADRKMHVCEFAVEIVTGALGVWLADAAEIEKIAEVVFQVVRSIFHLRRNLGCDLRFEAFETVFLRFEAEDVASPQVFERRLGVIEPGNHQLHGSLLEMFTLGPVYRVPMHRSGPFGPQTMQR